MPSGGVSICGTVAEERGVSAPPGTVRPEKRRARGWPGLRLSSERG